MHWGGSGRESFAVEVSGRGEVVQCGLQRSFVIGVAVVDVGFVD